MSLLRIVAEMQYHLVENIGGAFGSYMILSAIPGSQGLYGFVGYFIIKGFLTESMTMLQGAAIFGAGLLTGLVCLFSSYYQAKICANGIAVISPNSFSISTTCWPAKASLMSFLISVVLPAPRKPEKISILVMIQLPLSF